MEKISERILIEIEPSPTLTAFILVTHLLALVALCVATPFEPMAIVALPFILISGYLGWSGFVRFQGARVTRRIELSSKGEWTLFDGNGEEKAVRLRGGSFVSNRLMVLDFSLGNWRRRSVVLLPENTQPDQLRRLRVYLRHRL
jgi:toxin CptA